MDAEEFQALLDRFGGKWRGLEWTRAERGWTAHGCVLVAECGNEDWSWSIGDADAGWSRDSRWAHADPNDALDEAIQQAQRIEPGVTRFLAQVTTRRIPSTDYDQWLCSSLAQRGVDCGFALSDVDICTALADYCVSEIFEAMARAHARDPGRSYKDVKDLLLELGMENT